MDLGEENVRTIRKLYAALNAHDVEAMGRFLGPEFDWVVIAREHVTRDADAMVEAFRSFVMSFPDIHVEIENVIASGAVVVIEWRAHGTNTGPWDEQTPATGKSFERRGCSVAELEDGKIVRYRDYFDRAQMLKPLGLMRFI
jgi:steroid delta-isomerase-like uncharacterized protein